jgi:tripartite-type tricarboxylate transporter receptor subunit TctC
MQAILQRAHALFFTALIAAAMPCAAQAAEVYPARPVTLIVPFAAGGTSDVLGRLIADKMKDTLGQSVVVELKPGAGGNIGGEYVARSRPDGYTVLYAGISLSTNVSLMKLNFDPRRDLTPVGGVAAIPHIVGTSGEGPYKTINDLVSAARAQPGKLTYGSSGPGTGSHLAGELLNADYNLSMTHVPYKGAGAVYPDLIAERISVLIDLFDSAMVHVKSGRVRALAVTSLKRSPALPEVPTLAESGFPGYEFVTWQGLFAPAGTPPEALQKLEAGLDAALRSAEVRARLQQAGSVELARGAAGFGRYYQADVERWARLVKNGKIAALP